MKMARGRGHFFTTTKDEAGRYVIVHHEGPTMYKLEWHDASGRLRTALTEDFTLRQLDYFRTHGVLVESELVKDLRERHEEESLSQAHEIAQLTEQVRLLEANQRKADL